ncbi:hypothetical protein E1281_23540 [Actinomadura sp. KC345]|nr:hypothetical protein E1281_23540 [Actinomadura sp. KC345]
MRLLRRGRPPRRMRRIRTMRRPRRVRWPRRAPGSSPTRPTARTRCEKGRLPGAGRLDSGVCGAIRRCGLGPRRCPGRRGGWSGRSCGSWSWMRCPCRRGRARCSRGGGSSSWTTGAGSRSNWPACSNGRARRCGRRVTSTGTATG